MLCHIMVMRLFNFFQFVEYPSKNWGMHYIYNFKIGRKVYSLIHPIRLSANE